MNIGRIGHYHTPTGEDNAGFCQAALVIGTPTPEQVNIQVWSHEGLQQYRGMVTAGSPRASEATFHLGLDCPWSR